MVDSNTYQQQRQQVVLLGATVFGSVVAAIVASTFIVMQLVSGQIASALTSNVTAPTSATTTVAGSCVDTSAAPAAAAGAPGAGGAGAHHAKSAMKGHAGVLSMKGVHNSFNTSSVVNNTSTVKTWNKEINNSKNFTVIKDSFNKEVDVDSHDKTLVIKDNEVNLNSNNEANPEVTTVNTVVTHTEQTNNVVTENHLLSDNYVKVD